MKILAAMLLVIAQAPAQAQQGELHIHVAGYGKSLGTQRVDDIGNVSFPGEIVASGKLRIEPSGPELCGGACAYFMPDAASQKQLPGIVTPAGTVPVGNISLYDASPVLATLLGPKQAKALLSKRVVYQLPATFVLRSVRIYVACGSINYEARVARKISVGSYVALNDLPQQYGC